MANSAQARKRARQTIKQRSHNMAQRSEIRTAIKKVRKAIEEGNQEAAMKQMHESQSVIDRIADKKIMHKNTASRTKSRLVHAIRAMKKA